MGLTNKTLGNGFETQLCDLLFQCGYWAHNLAQNSAGQPADVIAVKNGRAYLIDCKVCSNGYFSRSRIEENQRLAMELWQQSGNGCGWFAVKFGENIYMIPLITLDLAESANLAEGWFQVHTFTLNEWLEGIWK